MISRRAVLVGALASGCVKRVPAVEQFRTFMNDLPRAVAGRVPFEPWNLEGKVSLVTFIATWCFPCLTELVVLQHLQRDYEARGFRNVLVGMDLEGFEVLEPFATGYKLEMPLVIADDRIRAGETSWGRIRELPSRVLFNRDGQIAVAYSGVATYESLDAVVKKLL